MRTFDAVAKNLRDIGADSVYMLLHSGWEQEGRANRWHFAKRWATYLDVVMVLPDLAWSGYVTIPEPRLQNCRILKVAANRGTLWRPSAQIQTAQILDDLAISGHSRPLFWLYNANFAEAFTAIPAVARVHHITENFFDYPAMSPRYLDRVKTVTRSADLNVSVSEGCAFPLRDVAKEERLIVVTNGCDFAEYGASGAPDETAFTLRKRFTRLGVFGGNINDRLDFDLIKRSAEQCPDTLLLFIGPISSDARVKSQFGQLLQHHNIKSLGAVNPDRLPAIYRAADFGFIPYTHDRLLVDNGFPLKALEMAAAGLPVISTYMRPLESLSPPLTVTPDDKTFLSAFKRAHSTPHTRKALRNLAAANDYDSKFSYIVSHLASLEREAWPHGAPVSPLSTTTPEQLRKLLGDYRNSLRYHVDGIYYRVAAAMYKLLELLPVSIVQKLRKIKWAIGGEIRG
jgi:glycosyltransferase involved in cell wall biosynthesis